MLNVIKTGFRKGWLAFLELVKIIVPIYILVTFLRFTGIVGVVANFFSPIMKFLGLPGEAMLALLTSYLINIYAGIGVILSLDLGVKEITILGTMIGICHSLLMESAIFKKIGVSIFKINLLRLSLSFLSGLILNWLL